MSKDTATRDAAVVDSQHKQSQLRNYWDLELIQPAQAAPTLL